MYLGIGWCWEGEGRRELEYFVCFFEILIGIRVSGIRVGGFGFFMFERVIF